MNLRRLAIKRLSYVMILLAFLLPLMTSDLNQPYTHNFETTV